MAMATKKNKKTEGRSPSALLKRHLGWPFVVGDPFPRMSIHPKVPVQSGMALSQSGLHGVLRCSKGGKKVIARPCFLEAPAVGFDWIVTRIEQKYFGRREMLMDGMGWLMFVTGVALDICHKQDRILL